MQCQLSILRLGYGTSRFHLSLLEATFIKIGHPNLVWQFHVSPTSEIIHLLFITLIDAIPIDVSVNFFRTYFSVLFHLEIVASNFNSSLNTFFSQ